KQNLPGGTSAVVPPDPMPNSEVKRKKKRRNVEDDDVDRPGRQASNKAKGPVERLGLLLLCYDTLVKRVDKTEFAWRH
ncbi:hypothetical protein, partial [Klebsiella pneumoniae]|uniref:hypothetical protein n=1 Tax=Klebsiella pneumoniae TaxID=573 RepID=UPI001AEF7CF0